MIAPSQPPTDADRTLLDFFEQVYRPLKLIGCSPNTSRQYRIMIGVYSRHLGRDARLSDLTDVAVAGFLSLYSEGRSPCTVNKARDHLVALWNYAARKRLVYEFPDVPKIPAYKRRPQAWTPEQVQAIFNACITEPGTIETIPAWQWWTALVMTTLDTGVRIGAMRQMKLADVDLPRGTLFVPAEIQKHRTDESFRLHPQTVQVLQATVDASGRREMLFPWPGDPIKQIYHYRNILIRAGLPHGPRDLFHKLRRTTATWSEIYMGRGVATQYLGHSTPRVTAAYIDRSMLPDLDVASKIPRARLSFFPAGSEGDPATEPEPRPAGEVVDLTPVGDGWEVQSAEDLAGVPFDEAMAAYLHFLELCDVTTAHVVVTRYRLHRVADYCAFDRIGDIRPEPVLQYLADLRDGKIGRYKHGKITLATQLDILRRLKEKPHHKHRVIARAVGVSHPTVDALAKRGKPWDTAASGPARVRQTLTNYRTSILSFVRWLADEHPDRYPTNLRDFLTEIDGQKHYWSTRPRARLLPE